MLDIKFGGAEEDSPLAIKYKPSLTLAKFHASSARIRCVKGPFGSGKSSAMCIEIFRRACEQNVFRGKRVSKWAIVRNTSDQLKSTTMKTWKTWFPEEICHLRADNTALMSFPLPDGTTVELELLFKGLDIEKQKRDLLSLELTGIWFNEATEIRKDIFADACARTGRWPQKDMGGSNWSGALLDYNPPSTRNWLYTLAEELRPEGYEFFHQPGALIRKPNGEYVIDPMAENIDHLDLGYQYYFNMIPGNSEDFINCRVLGEYGATFDGKPVYGGAWRDSVHVAKEPIKIFRGLPLYLGTDFGNTPAMAVAQMSPGGRVNVLREWVSSGDGLRTFVDEVVRPAMLNEFAGMSIISRCDPAGATAAEADKDVSCLNVLNVMGIPTSKALTQDPVARREAVLYWLNRMVDGEPAFQLDPSCTMLREGFNGGYHFSRVRMIGDERYRDKPEKNEYSHIHDGLQYIMLTMTQGQVISGDMRPKAAVRQQSGAGWEGSV